ncbi:MAG: hypothetical protein WCE79_16690 [Xanthobacteraceae bacterium]
MHTLSILIENFQMLGALLAATNPVSALYGLLAGTYGRAWVAAGANDHHTLGRCYLISAALHGLIGVCHHLHI